MKKVCLFLSVCLMAQPIAYATTTNATTTNNSNTNQAQAELPDINGTNTIGNTNVPAEKKFKFMDGVSGTFALTTDYVFRGISQTENLPAVQGGLTYTLPVGLYFNTWGSNVKFTDSEANIEIDTVGGIRNSIGDDFSYDINYARYNYPRAPELEYNELNTVFKYFFIQAGISYSANVYNSHDEGTYYNGGINYDIPAQYLFNFEGVNITALIGHYSFPSATPAKSYNDYNIGVSKALNDVYIVMAQWTGTNHKNPPYDRNQINGTITANF